MEFQVQRLKNGGEQASQERENGNTPTVRTEVTGNSENASKRQIASLEPRPKQRTFKILTGFVLTDCGENSGAKNRRPTASLRIRCIIPNELKKKFTRHPKSRLFHNTKKQSLLLCHVPRAIVVLDTDLLYYNKHSLLAKLYTNPLL